MPSPFPFRTIDPATGQQVWQFRDGRTLPVVSGGADEPAPEPADEPEPEPAPEPEPESEPADEPLGEPGKRALDAERRRRADAIKRAEAAEAELKKVRDQQMTDAERQVAEARTEGEQAADGRWRERTGRLAVKAAAAGRFADPADVARYLDDGVPFTKDGEVDEAALDEALEQLLADRPYLAAPKPGTPKAPSGPRGSEQADPGSMSMEEYRQYRRGKK